MHSNIFTTLIIPKCQPYLFLAQIAVNNCRRRFAHGGNINLIIDSNIVRERNNNERGRQVIIDYKLCKNVTD